MVFFLFDIGRIISVQSDSNNGATIKVDYGENFGICKVKLLMNDYVPANVKIPQKKYSMEATQVTLLLLVVGHLYSVVGLIDCGLLVIGRWSLVRVTIGCNSISMQFYERPKTTINLY